MLILLLACTSDPAQTPLSISVEASPAGTAFTARWRSEQPGEARVELGPDTAYGSVILGTSSEDGLDHAVVVAGLAGGTEWHWRAATEGDALEVSADQEFVPTPPPADLPDLTVSGSWDGLAVVPVIGGGGTYAVIYNGEGHPVWWELVSQGLAPANQARLSLDGRAVLFLSPGSPDGDPPALVRTSIATGETERLPVATAHHDFVEVSDRVYVLVDSDSRAVGDYQVGGDRLLEVSESGSRVLWSTWDDLEVGDPAQLPRLNENERDWTHINSIAWDGSAWWLSSYNRHSLLIVDPEEGLLAEVGGLDSDYDLVDGAGFGPQHCPYPTRRGFLLFNNGSGQDAAPVSEAVAYEVNESTGTYSRVWTHRATPVAYTPVFGNVEPTSDEALLISWGAAGMLSVVDEAGVEAWRAEAPLGYGVGFAHPVDALAGTP